MIELLLQADRLLTVDLVDQAEAIYQRVAAADPHNAIAIVGLGRCALARGDDHDAYRLAAKALAIDPQNDMARRMEARLAEVLTYRGEVPGQAAGEAARSGELARPGGAEEGTAADPPGPTPAPGSTAPVTTPAPGPAPVERPARRSFLDRLRGR